MRSAESTRRRPVDQRRTPPPPNPLTPKSSAMRPAVVIPHPPLGWTPPEPPRRPAFRSVGKSGRTAFTWTLLFGPLGLCYLSVALGLVATMAAVVAIVLGGAALLAVIWPVSMILALLAAQPRN